MTPSAAHPIRRLRHFAAFGLVLCLLATPLRAALTFDFVCHTGGNHPYEFRGHGVLDGANVRYDVTEGNHPLFNPHVSIISREGGATLLILDHQRHTFFLRNSGGMSGPLSTWKAPGETGVTNPSVTIVRSHTPSAIVAGQETTVQDIEASYAIAMTVEGEKLQARVRARGTLWLRKGANQAMPYGPEFALKSGVASIDVETARLLRVEGIPLRAVITVTRTITGGEPISETFDFEMTSVTVGAVDEGSFDAPNGYVAHEPAFSYEATPSP